MHSTFVHTAQTDRNLLAGQHFVASAMLSMCSVMVFGGFNCSIDSGFHAQSSNNRLLLCLQPVVASLTRVGGSWESSAVEVFSELAKAKT